MVARDGGFTREIGDGAGHAQDAAVAARGQTHAFGGLGQKLLPRAVRFGDGIEKFAFNLGIGAKPRAFIARTLNGARLLHPAGNFGGAFRRRWKVRSAALTLPTSI